MDTYDPRDEDDAQLCMELVFATEADEAEGEGEFDPETGVAVTSRANIERFQDRSSHLVASLEVEMIRARRYDRPLSILILTTASHRGGKCDGRGFRQLNMEKRMRRLAPVILRQPDFWGRIERYGFLIVLTETDLAGADGAARRMVASEPFQQLLRDERGRNAFVLSTAQMDAGTSSLEELAAAAAKHVVWSTEPIAGLIPQG